MSSSSSPTITYAETMSDHEERQAILARGWREGRWVPMGMKDGSYIVLINGRTAAWTGPEVDRIAVDHYLQRA